ncbi:MAG: racemase [Lachnospiraceae bacterium]|nr:racemase [Lachnospiraceae bacterium]
MTREALKKLNKKQMNYCQTLSVLIAKDRENGAMKEAENYEKIHGIVFNLFEIDENYNEIRMIY